MQSAEEPCVQASQQPLLGPVPADIGANSRICMICAPMRSSTAKVFVLCTAHPVDQRLQRRLVENPDLALPHVQHAVVLELREAPAHRLELEPEVITDLLASHPQH